MSEQALQGLLIQGSGLQSCWGKQKMDALQGIWHLSFTGASLPGDHSAALQPGWCKSDHAPLPWWVTIPGQSSFKLTSDQRSWAKDAFPPPHSTPSSPCLACQELEVFSFPSHQLCLSENQESARLASVCDLMQRKRGANLREWNVMVVSWLSAFPAWALEWQELVWHQTQRSRAGAAAVGAAACVLCWCS